MRAGNRISAGPVQGAGSRVVRYLHKSWRAAGPAEGGGLPRNTVILHDPATAGLAGEPRHA